MVKKDETIFSRRRMTNDYSITKPPHKKVPAKTTELPSLSSYRNTLLMLKTCVLSEIAQ